MSVWGVGRLTGGEGSLGLTYMLGLAAFSGGAAAPDAPLVGLVIGTILMPFTAPLGFELGSHLKAKELEEGTASVRPNLVPLSHGGSMTGAMAGLGGTF